MKFELMSGFKFLSCGIFTSPSENWKHMWRECGFYELFYVTEGRVYLRVDDTEWVLEKGDYLITPSGCRQVGYKESGCRFYWFHFQCEENGAEYPSNGHYSDPDMIGSYYYILRHRDGNGAHGGLVIQALLSELRQTEQGKIPVSGLCYAVKEYIRANPPADISVERLAKRFNYSSHYLSTLFARKTGITLNRYIFDDMMTRAKSMLKYTNKKISDIGLTLGYSDGQNFSHAFKNAFGISPKEYRNAYRAS